MNLSVLSKRHCTQNFTKSSMKWPLLSKLYNFSFINIYIYNTYNYCRTARLLPDRFNELSYIFYTFRFYSLNFAKA